MRRRVPIAIAALMALIVAFAPMSIAQEPGASCQLFGADVDTVASAAECDALETFYEAMGGVDGFPSNLEGWGTATDPCTWSAITCDETGVVELASSTGFDGELPAALGQLVNLRILTLKDGAISGPIPLELANLTNLTTLKLDENALSGPVPVALGALQELEVLHLGNNQLTGPIPVELTALSSLRELSMFLNNLEGPIPSELGALNALELLRLSNNELDGPIPAELGGLTQLRVLGLSDNGLTGMIPTELAQLIELQELSLSDNQLHGSIPSEFAQLDALQQFRVRGNNLTGAIPDELAPVLADVGSMFFLSDGPGGNDCFTASSAALIVELDRLDSRWTECDAAITSTSNCDDSLDILDAFAIAEYIVGLRTAASCPHDGGDSLDPAAADFDADGDVDVLDVLLLARCVVDLDTIRPCPAVPE